MFKLFWLKPTGVPLPEALTVTEIGRQAPPAVQTLTEALPAAMPEIVMMLPFKLD